jgi:hypothetical protein
LASNGTYNANFVIIFSCWLGVRDHELPPRTATPIQVPVFRALPTILLTGQIFRGIWPLSSAKAHPGT